MASHNTNYDDAVEFAHLQLNKHTPSYNYDDPKPKKLVNGSVISLHGVIRSATEENILNQLILNESSYVRQHFEKSTWYDDFSRDLRFCTACFFVGYSLSDYHISALLMQSPSIPTKKLAFVTRKSYDKMLKPDPTVGANPTIEIDGFATLCSTLPPPEPINDPYVLKSLRFIDPFKDKRTLTPPTATEIFNLVTFGSFNYQRCLATLPSADYITPREAPRPTTPFPIV